MVTTSVLHYRFNIHDTSLNLFYNEYYDLYITTMTYYV